MLTLILLIVALVAFVAACFNWSAPVNLIALGLAFWVLSLVLAKAGVA